MARFGQLFDVVGRHDERAVISAFLDTVPSGVCGLLIEGPAGVGKSMLWQTGIAQAHDQGHRVLACRPVETEAQLSFAAITDLLDPALGDALPHLPKPQRRGLEAALLRVEADDAADERAVAFGFLTALRALGRSGPVLIAVDDWQWLDMPSERVLRFALRRLSEEPVGMLGTVRTPSGSGPDGALPETRMTRLPLGALSLAALHQLLVDRVDVSFPRRTLLKIQDTTAGNIIFAIEIARLLVERGEALPPDARLPIPATFNQLVAQRVAALPAATREVLLAASALAQPTIDLLRSVAGMPAPDEALATAVRAELVELDDGRVRFSHPLIAAAVYASAPADHRRIVHDRLARVVGDAEEHARHLALAAQEPSEAVAEALEQAAVTARLRGAPDAAAELCELAIKAAPPDTAAVRRRLSVAAAEHHFVAGDRQRARQLLEQVLPDCPAGQERAHALRLLGEVRYHDDSIAEADRLLRESLAEAGDDAAERAAVLCNLVYIGHAGGQLSEAVEHGRAALAAATEARLPPGQMAEVMAVLTIIEFLSGHGLDEQRLRRAMELEDVTLRTPAPARPSVIHGVLMSWTGRSAEAQASLDRLRNQLLELGDESALPLLAFIAAPEACARGDLADAEHHGREGLEAAARLGTDIQLAYALTAMGYVHAYAGRTDTALHYAERAIALFTQVGAHAWAAWPLSAIGFTHLSRDDPAAADAALRPWLDAVPTGAVQEPTRVPFVPVAIQALIMLGELEVAEPVLDWFEQLGRHLDRPWALATAGRCRGLLHAARGDLDGALATLEHAVTIHRRLRHPVEEARTLLALGQLQRRANQRRTAHDTLERAARIFAEVGAAQWLGLAHAELTRLGLHRPAGPELTPRERQVAEHAATGATNNNIAAALYISPKTVEAALARVYRKLSISSRAELGAWMAEQDRAEGPTP